ncbi:hypothetical protein V9T40_004581 [Parthenolecanium corni]|uniref:Uncharacterized protein n=1 Tax=Parthenolecanium corni TaxID=536013 RepID=A0AAN9Y8S2_9HEMI
MRKVMRMRMRMRVRDGSRCPGPAMLALAAPDFFHLLGYRICPNKLSVCNSLANFQTIEENYYSA